MIKGSDKAPLPKTGGSRYWFAAKRFGWGWGQPLTWQGWVVYVGWMAGLIGEIVWLGTDHRPLPHVLFVGAMVVLLFVICYWKGEPPRWRWGD